MKLLLPGLMWLQDIRVYAVIAEMILSLYCKFSENRTRKKKKHIKITANYICVCGGEGFDS